ncbi:HNH endonuclease [Streptomyces sp. NPDC057638]|uniref:HNH endonuclease n=1 Tax=Streptomyces sp. NPDC057638 TaxID=3346190 RepID=UPI0036B36BC0
MPSALTPQGSTSEWRRTRARVLAEEPSCRWCGAASTVVDHIIPRARGGDDRRENLCGSCAPCNLARGAGGGTAPPSREW